MKHLWIIEKWIIRSFFIKKKLASLSTLKSCNDLFYASNKSKANAKKLQNIWINFLYIKLLDKMKNLIKFLD